MKISLFSHVAAYAVSLFAASSAFGQGSLTPPGAPAPTMKTLDQIEPRIPIPGSAVGLTPPFVISQSGSYYLTGNVSVSTGDAIQIQADNVSLDLGGFTVSSTSSPANGQGIDLIGTRQNVAIRNGSIVGTTTYSGGAFSGGGFVNGIYGTPSMGLVVESVTVRGVYAFGFSLSTTSSLVRGCYTGVTGGNGIVGQVIVDCVVETAGGGFGIAGATVTRCRATNVSSAVNAYGITGDNVTDCTGTCAGGSGIFAGATGSNCYGVSQAGGSGVSGDCLINCKGTSVSGTGISSTTITTNCHGVSTSGTGLSTGQATNCQGESSSGTGISATFATNCLGRTNGTAATSYGINCANGTATSSRGIGGGGSSTAINAVIGIGCVTTGGTVTITNKYNMP